MIKIKGLRVRVEEKEVLKGVDLSIERGKVLALMGPNGSGKSSLASTIIGNPKYFVSEGQILFEGEEILKMSVDKRAKKGILLAFQSPVAIPGVTVREMLLTAIRARKEMMISALELKRRVEMEAEKLNISSEMLDRGINDGFSGGEKKKMEILQMRVLKPKLLILDEIDSGLDIDALSLVAGSVVEMVRENKMSVLVITHHQRILNYLTPNKVVVMKGGVIVKTGGREIVEDLEKYGYK